MKLPYTFKIGSWTVEIVSGREKPLESFLVKAFFVGLIIFLLAGCSTLGEIEGTGKFGETLRALESSRNLLGKTPDPSPEAAVINRKLGEARQIDDKTEITQVIQSVKYIFDR